MQQLLSEITVGLITVPGNRRCVMITCFNCGGTGDDPLDYDCLYPCATCAGEGQIILTRTPLAYPPTYDAQKN